MARTSFVNLEDFATEAGVPLHRALEDDSILMRNAQGALVAKDSMERFKYLNVDNMGRLLVNDDQDSVCTDIPDVEIANATGGFTLVTEVALTQSTNYKDLEWLVSSFRDTKYRIEAVTDEGGGGEAIIPLVSGRVGPGLFDSCCRQQCKEFVTTGVGTQKIRILAENQNAASPVSASGTISKLL